MWVLDARADAEKVTYPVVWEEKKDASNVVDYDIRDEETKDVSAEINANNQTTTGMANAIPWVNAPKLIASTSIYDNTSNIAYITWSVSMSDTSEHQYWNFTYQKVIGVWYWTSTNSLKIPSDWEYNIQLIWRDQQQWANPNTWYKNTFYIKYNWTNVMSWTFQFRLRWTLEWVFKLKAWDIITFWVKSDVWASWTWSCSATITKL